MTKTGNIRRLDLRKRFVILATGFMAIAFALVFGQVNVPIAAGTGAAQVPDWQTAAGGKREFDVASVKLNKSGSRELGGDQPGVHIPFGGEDFYTPTGGVLTATNMPLISLLAPGFRRH